MDDKVRVVIDLQACQAGSSRFRGIGRYSHAIAKAMATQSRGHEVWIFLSALFPDSAADFRREFQEIIPGSQIVVWHTARSVSFGYPANRQRRLAAEASREAFLAALRPDIVHVASFFEGFGEDIVTSIKQHCPWVSVAVTVYDLIPWQYRDIYLSNLEIRQWYSDKLQSLKRADVLLCISEFTRSQTLQTLGLEPDRAANISGAAGEFFKPAKVSPKEREEIFGRLGIRSRFVLYTGGMDPRKNIEGLVEAYAALPEELRKREQLVVVCRLEDSGRKKLTALAESFHLGSDVVFTGEVSDDDLRVLYSLCTLFVFPSWSEGFGLPLLEAMGCGAAVLSSKGSSLDEVMGRSDCTFDPMSVESISCALSETLNSEERLLELRAYGLERVKSFSWERSAEMAWDALEAFVARRRNTRPISSLPPKNLLTYISPLPPQRSGIADYSHDMLPALSAHFSLHLIANGSEVNPDSLPEGTEVHNPDLLRKNYGNMGSVMYQMGNSEFHEHMFELFEECPGVVVLHDSSLYTIQEFLSIRGGRTEMLNRALHYSHGFPALIDQLSGMDYEAMARTYHSNLPMLERADAVIVHSEHARETLQSLYGQDFVRKVHVVPLPHKIPETPSREAAFQKLGIPAGPPILCSFGHLTPHKGVLELIDAWSSSKTSRLPGARLVLVGADCNASFGAEIERRIAGSASPESIRKTGFIPREEYLSYLAVADVAIQLRKDSLGESSRAVLDCLGAGIATIVTNEGTFSEIPDGAVRKAGTTLNVDELAEAIDDLMDADCTHESLGQAGVSHVATNHAPDRVAARIAEIMRQLPDRNVAQTFAAIIPQIRALAHHDQGTADVGLIREVSDALSRNIATLTDRLPVLMIWGKTGLSSEEKAHVLAILKVRSAGYRIELVQQEGQELVHARSLACELLGLKNTGLVDEPVEFRQGDVFVFFNFPAADFPLSRLRACGVRLIQVATGQLSREALGNLPLIDMVICQDDEMAKVISRDIRNSGFSLSSASRIISLFSPPAQPPRKDAVSESLPASEPGIAWQSALRQIFQETSVR